MIRLGLCTNYNVFVEMSEREIVEISALEGSVKNLDEGSSNDRYGT